MPFRIKFVEDKDLPKNVDWAIARDEQGQMFFVKQSRICPDVLAEAWAAADQLKVPEQRLAAGDRQSAYVEALAAGPVGCGRVEVDAGNH